MISDYTDDRGLIEEVLKDRENFVKLYRKYINKIYRYCYYKLNGDVHITEDIVSQTFLKLFEIIEKVALDKKYDYSILPYSYAIARNYIFQFWREQSGKVFVDLESMEYFSNSEQDNELLDKQIDSETVIKEINNLDMLTRDIIYLKIYEDMTFEDISNELKIQISKTKMRYYRGIKYVKNKLKINICD